MSVSGILNNDGCMSEVIILEAVKPVGNDQ
jgi:hypothetical protein